MTTLTFGQIEDLWTRNGGNPAIAPVMAAIALAESGGRTDVLNTKAPDYSVGLWQINYYGNLGPSRTAQYGSPADLVADPNRQAQAAVAISGNGSNLSPWSTYTNGSYKTFLGSTPGTFVVSAYTGPNASNPAPNLTGQDSSGLTDDEGYLFQFEADPLKSVPLIGGLAPSATLGLRRSTVRKMVGAGSLIGGVVVMGAGLFLLAGRRPVGPSRIVVEALRQRGLTQRETTRQENIGQRAEERARERRSRTSSEQGPGEEPF